MREEYVWTSDAFLAKVFHPAFMECPKCFCILKPLLHLNHPREDIIILGPPLFKCNICHTLFSVRVDENNNPMLVDDDD